MSSYYGIEIDMLNLGDADSILVSKWDAGGVTRILIDGGYRKDAETVQNFLDSMGILHIDHLVCTHIHDDHAGGLVELVEGRRFSIGNAWMHIPTNHVDGARVQNSLSRAKAAGLKRAMYVEASLKTVHDLQFALLKRGIFPVEPFLFDQIGFMKVCSPSRELYEEKLLQFANFDEFTKSAMLLEKQDLGINISDGVRSAFNLEPDLLDSPITDPENEASIVLGTEFNGSTILLTADAGVEAFGIATANFDLTNLTFMQIPHHGSRRNITKSLINYFSPKCAFVSAAGNVKHPRRAVINAFKEAGSLVYSTHYPSPGSHKWRFFGSVPPRGNYTDSIYLYDAS